MKSFAEQARELKASQEAAVAAKQAAEDAVKEKQRRINTDGPAAAQQLAAEVIADIKRQVIEAGPDGLFRLPEQPQRGAALEIVVAGKWLMTGEVSGTQFTLGTHELTWLRNPRARQYGQEQVEPDFVVYQIETDSSGAWVWREIEDTAMRGVFMAGFDAISPFTNAELIERILHKVLALAERKPKDENGGAGGLFF